MIEVKSKKFGNSGKWKGSMDSVKDIFKKILPGAYEQLEFKEVSEK